jgi:hypothetical protein
MSRSFKKYPHHGSSSPNYKKFAKRQANKKVRRSKDLYISGKLYKKLYCSWNIEESIYIDFHNGNLFNTYPKYKFKIK